MKIKRRGWIGKGGNINAVAVTVDDEYNPPGLSEGDIVIQFANERGTKEEWNRDWPPKLIDVTIEVEEVLLCDVCGEPSDFPPSSSFVTSFTHASCANARTKAAKKAKEFYREMERVPDLLKKEPKKKKVCLECGNPWMEGDTVHANLDGNFVHHECVIKEKIGELELPKRFHGIDGRYVMKVRDKINEIIDRLDKAGK